MNTKEQDFFERIEKFRQYVTDLALSAEVNLEEIKELYRRKSIEKTEEYYYSLYVTISEVLDCLQTFKSRI